MDFINESMTRIFADGGLVLAAIGGASVIAWALIFYKWADLRAQHAESARAGHGFVNESGVSRVVLELWIRGERGRLEGGLGPIQASAALMPLLGLLGTVLGMLTTFDVIQIEGTGDPRLMANGIRQALLTTQVGILAAVPVLLGLRYLSSRALRMGDQLELALHCSAFSRRPVEEQLPS